MPRHAGGAGRSCSSSLTFGAARRSPQGRLLLCWRARARSPESATGSRRTCSRPERRRGWPRCCCRWMKRAWQGAAGALGRCREEQTRFLPQLAPAALPQRPSTIFQPWVRITAAALCHTHVGSLEPPPPRRPPMPRSAPPRRSCCCCDLRHCRAPWAGSCRSSGV
jgi:hypothetical protein